MSDELYIIPRNWERFQHADVTRSGTPPWIRIYTRLLHDDNYLQLSGHRRAVLCGIWLEYASSGCRLRVDTASLTRRLALRVTTSDLKALNHAGFLEFLQAERLHDARPRDAREEEIREERTTNDEREARPQRVDGFETVGDLAAAILELERSHP